MAKRKGITCCDTTDHGGRVLEGYSTMRHKGHRVAGKGHEVFCPKCHGVFPIVESLSSFLGYAPALEGMRTGCGARLIASHDDLWFDEDPTADDRRVAPENEGGEGTPGAPINHRDGEGSSTKVPIETGTRTADASHVVFRIGLFNDGTGNNYPNSQAAMERCTPKAADLDKHPGVLEQLMAACRKDNSLDGASYAGGETNVHRLYDLYEETDLWEKVSTRDDGRRYVYRHAYIQGVGTQKEHPDSLFASALGWGPTGVIARAEEAVKAAVQQIAKFVEDNAAIHIVIDAVEFDLYGFSRGATASRHVASLIRHAGDNGVMARKLRERGLPLKPGWDGGNKSDLRIRFIGLFESVAAIGKPNNNDNDPVKLYLDEDCADDVFHLVARDECRENFALNRVMPYRHTEVSVPGVHSDIGGGYHMTTMEQVILTRPEMSVERLDQDRYKEWVEFARRYDTTQPLDFYLSEVARTSAAVERTGRQLREAPVLRKDWLIDPQLNPSPNDDNYTIQKWPKVIGDPRQHLRGAVTDVALQVMAALVALRQVRGEYQLVTLRIMHAMSQAAGVPLDFIDDSDPKFSLPADLVPIHRKLLAYAKTGGKGEVPLTLTEQEQLSRRYLHQSAHWNPGEWKASFEEDPNHAGEPTRATLPVLWNAGLKLVFPMRPADRRLRLIFDQRKGH